jgi:transposase
MAIKTISDELWSRIEPLLPPPRPRPRGGRPRAGDRASLDGIIFVLETGIPWFRLPLGLGFGSGMTCWRRWHEWTDAGAWPRIQQALLDELGRARQIDWERASIDSASVPAPKGGP